MIAVIVLFFFFVIITYAIFDKPTKPTVVINNSCCKDCTANKGKDNIIPEIDDDYDDLITHNKIVEQER